MSFKQMTIFGFIEVIIMKAIFGLAKKLLSLPIQQIL